MQIKSDAEISSLGSFVHLLICIKVPPVYKNGDPIWVTAVNRFDCTENSYKAGTVRLFTVAVIMHTKKFWKQISDVAFDSLDLDEVLSSYLSNSGMSSISNLFINHWYCCVPKKDCNV